MLYAACYMTQYMKVAVVVPAYNEAERIQIVLKHLIEQGFEVIAVDDGSSDGTAEAIRVFPVKLASHCANIGQGAALRTGTELARELGYDAVAHFDADGQHRIEDLRALVAELQNGETDIAIGSRFMGVASNLPAKKRLIYFFARLFSRYFLGLAFTDPQSGLRAFKLGQWDKIKWGKDNFEHCSEILGLIRKNNLRYKEIPIQVIYDELNQTKRVRPRVSMGLRLILAKIFD